MKTFLTKLRSAVCRGVTRVLKASCGLVFAGLALWSGYGIFFVPNETAAGLLFIAFLVLALVSVVCFLSLRNRVEDYDRCS